MNVYLTQSTRSHPRWVMKKRLINRWECFRGQRAHTFIAFLFLGGLFSHEQAQSSDDTKSNVGGGGRGDGGGGGGRGDGGGGVQPASVFSFNSLGKKRKIRTGY